MLETALTVAFLSIPAFQAKEETHNPYRKYHEIIAARKVSDLSVEAFIDAEHAFSAYLKHNRRYPDGLGDLFPGYGFAPPVPEGMQWSYGPGGDGSSRYFCLSGLVSERFSRSFSRTMRMFEGHPAYFSGNCGAASSTINTSVKAGAQIAITYWIAYETESEIVLPVELECKNRKEWYCKKKQHVRDKLKEKRGALPATQEKKAP